MQDRRCPTNRVVDWRGTIGVLLVVMGCGPTVDDDNETNVSGLGSIGTSADSESSSTTTSGGGSSDGGSGTTTASTMASTSVTPIFDIGASASVSASASAGDPTGDGCQKIDFLFVVDSSGSMSDEQMNLMASFPGFISTIRDQLDVQDYHIMVVDTDAEDYEWCRSQLCAWNPGSYCINRPCASLPPPTTGCEATLGAGKVNDFNDTPCGITGTRRYIVDGQPNLDATFGCLANVGTTGSGDEQQAGAAVTALSSMMNDPGGCNDGFLRNDAILVLTIITDEEDGEDGDPDMSSPGNAASWKQAIVDAKLGDEQAVVVLALVGDPDVPSPTCTPGGGAQVNGAEPAAQLRQFAESFAHGSWGSVCAPDYTPFFQQAVGVIDSACDDFVPPA